MRSDVAEALAGAVRANPLIRRLSLAGVKWRDMRDQHDRSAKGVTAFAAAMPGSSVTSLDLSDSDIGPSACARLAKALSGKNAVRVRSEVNTELKFPPNFEGLVLGCIDADFCK